MDEFADRPLERAPALADPGDAPKRLASTPIIVIAVGGLAIGALAAWWWVERSRPTPAAMATDAARGSEAVVGSEPARSLPPVGQMDTFLRALLGALSSHPDALRWLASENLIQQMAHGIDRISRGQSPARDVPMLHPKGALEVVHRGRQTFIDTSTYRRYDALATLVDALDARAVAQAYRTIQPRLDEAYRALGRSENNVDDAVGASLRLLIETPIPSDPIAVVPGKGATWAFADPKYEQLASIQRQLLRMGPANARRVQTRLREINTALETAAAR